MTACLKCTYELTALRLEKLLTGTRSVLSPFVIYTRWFLVLNNAFRNGSVVACSTACSIAAEWMKWVNTEVFRNWPKRRTHHRSTTTGMTYSVASPDFCGRNTYGTNIQFWSHFVQIIDALKKAYWQRQFNLNTGLSSLKRWIYVR